MPFELYTPDERMRLLISGFSKQGKTTSLPTFLYGPYDYLDPEQQADALAYANGKSMVILSCPGETGISALRRYVGAEHLTIYRAFTEDGVDTSKPEWSGDAVAAFLDLVSEVHKNKPDIMMWDGLHGLYEHMLNYNTNGEALAGHDLNVNPETGRVVQYRAASFYSRTGRQFKNPVVYYYNSNIPIFGCTVGERWEEIRTQQDKPDVQAKRYLWPDISGEMANRIVTMFDMRLSARVEPFCLDPTCEYRQKREDHYVWQFYPRGDVSVVGIRGLRINKAMQRDPYIHQNYDDLRQLIEMFS